MASQQQEKNVSRTFVAVDAASPATILGFYTLTVSEVDGSHYSAAKKLPNRIPVAKIGRFAVAPEHQGRGLGTHLLIHALDKVCRISMHAGIFAVVVDAKDEKAAAFYEKHGFTCSPENRLRLFILTATLQQAFKA